MTDSANANRSTVNLVRDGVIFGLCYSVAQQARRSSRSIRAEGEKPAVAVLDDEFP